MKSRQVLLAVLVLLPMMTVLVGAFEIHVLLDEAVVARNEIAIQKKVAGALRSTVNACTNPPVLPQNSSKSL